MNIFFADDGIVLKKKKKKKEEKGNKAEENCRKYATEMKNENDTYGSTKGGEKIRATMREKCTEGKGWKGRENKRQ